MSGNSSYSRICLSLLSKIFILLVAIVPAHAQQYSRTIHDGYTPTGVEQGAPAGAYPLSGFENVNLFNGSLGVALPLLNVGGRGTAGYTMTLQIDQHWEIYRYFQIGFTQDEAQFRAGRSWRVGYSPGVLLSLSSADSAFSGQCPNPPAEVQIQYLTRLDFVMPDGTEIFLYDKQYGGAPALVERCVLGPGYRNRGKVFVSADGESLTFISDGDISDGPHDGAIAIEGYGPSGHLLMKDGTRYRIDSGKVSWIRDRNGNKVSFAYQQAPQGYWRVISITDSLNRVINISYASAPTGYDEISFKGFDQAPRSVKVWYNPMANILRPDFTIKKANQLFPEVYAMQEFWHGDWDHNPTLVSQIELPDHRFYQFRYNSYGEVARVILPTGGGFDYEHAGYAPAWPSGYQSVYDLIVYRRLAKRTAFNTLTPTTDPANPPAGTREKIEDYVVESPFDSGPTIVRVEQRDSGSVLKAQSKHYFYGNPALETACTPVHYSWWPSGKEYKTENFNVSGGAAGAVLRKSEPVWSPTVTGFSPPGSCITAPAPNPKIAEAINTLSDTNQVAKQTFSYDQYNNQTDVYEYDFGSGSPGALKRRTQTIYLTSGYDTIVGGVSNPDANATIHIRSFPTEQKVYDSAGTLRARTAYEYDNYNQGSSDVFHAALTNRASISGLVSRNGTAPGGQYSPTTDYLRGNVTKTTQYLLDNSGNVTGSTSGHAQYDIAGNVVKTLDPRSTTSNLIATTFEFNDRFGSPDDDARANSAPAQLGGQSSFAFATKITNALGHEAYTQYDYFIGKPVNSEDPNGIVSSVAYADDLDRPTQGIQARWKVGDAVAPSAKRQTTFVYDDTNRRITTTSDRDTFNDNILTGRSYYDGLGRTWRGATYEGNTGAGNTWAITDTQFDALGRVSQVSNPYRAADPNSSSPPSGAWTTTSYDALSRVTTVQTPDTAVVTTAYSGNVVTVTDQAGKQRRSLTDALGRLTRVDEPSGCNTCLGAVSSPTQPTDYLYDALGNLRKVTQGTQTRWFGYDSLSRLIRAKNSEQATNSSLPAYTDPVTGGSGWSTAYVYDANSNLTQKTDARNISVTYVYDALNRNTTVDYSDTTTINPDITRVYDNTGAGTNGKGRFWHDYAGGNYSAGQNVEHKAIDSYDALGRPLSVRQHFKLLGTWSNGFTTSQTYDLAGNVKTITYPSGRVVNYGYNTAGQLTSFTGKLGGLTGSGGVDVNYATAMQYNPRGQMIRETFGTNTALYQRKHYNRRGQLFDIRLGTDGSASWDVEDPQVWQYANGSWNRGALRLFYSPNLNDYSGANPAQPNNNGNIHRMDHFVPNALDGSSNITSWVMGSDDYLYDELNRLTRVTETPTGGTGPGFVQQFTYDRWGNRRIDINATTNLTGITRIDFKVLTANNRLVSPSDTTGDDPGTDLMRYDKAGNLVYDNYSPAVGQRGIMTYDAENHMLTAVNNSHQYRYGADGKRTRRLVAGSPEMWLVYGVNGELVAEYDAVMPGGTLKKEYGYRGGQMLIVYDGTLAGDEQLKWMVTDHLGSTRMLVNRSGNLSGIQRRDYLPFGEELASTIGHRNASGAGYVGGNNPRQKLTGYERDIETGLDFAQARYFSSVQGRFTGVDPENAGAVPDDPQSWNGYAYARNSPVVFGDPTGTEYKFCVDGKCSYHSDSNVNEWLMKKEFVLNKGKVFDNKGNQIGTYQYIDSSHGLFSGREMGQFYTEALPAVGTATKQAVAVVAAPYVIGAGVATGGAALGVGGIGFGTTVTTLGTLGRVVVPGAAILNQLGRGDAQVFQRAFQYGLSSANTFANNVAALVRGLRAVKPDAQVNKIGEIGNSPVFGSLKTGVGIAEVDGVQVVVKMVQGSPQIIGKLP